MELKLRIRARDNRIRELEAEIAGLRDPRNVSVRRDDLRSVLANTKGSEPWKRLVVAVEGAERVLGAPEGDGKAGSAPSRPEASQPRGWDQ
jgi:hypothetical protein